MEEVRKQFETLRIIKEHPDLLKRIEGLEQKISEQASEISSLREVERTVDGEKTTLPQLRELITKVKAEEIRIGARNLFNEYKTRWEKSEKPKEIYSEACRILAGIIGRPGEPRQRYLPVELIELGLPRRVDEILKAGVDARIDAEFHTRVDEESTKKADIEVKRRVAIEWPIWLGTNVEPKAKDLEEKLVNNALAALRGPWTVTCDKCGTTGDVEFQPDGLGQLLSQKQIHVECGNPSCKDFLVRHRIMVTLQKLVSHHLTT